MKNAFLLSLVLVLPASCAVAPIFAQTVSSDLPRVHPYDYALSYCQDRGGLARYTVSGDVVKFTCRNNLTQVKTISAK